MSTRPLLFSSALVLAVLFFAPSAQAEKKLLWGDTHLHTSNSFDAFLNLNLTADPDTAYRFAKGLPVIHPFHRARVQLETPLDFLVVADHAEVLGVIRQTVQGGVPRDDLGPIDSALASVAEYWLRSLIEDDESAAAFASLLPDTNNVEEAAATTSNDLAVPVVAQMSKTTWEAAADTADRYNEPGVFTTLIGWEWSSVPGGANLHRVVFTSAGAEVAKKFRPYSSADSNYPEDLWGWLDKTSMDTGAEFVAIPHNSNISKGYMFGETSLRGEPIGPEYAKLRLRWEPVVEATQYKGDSETHPALSPNDPFADFETYEHYIQQNVPEYEAGIGDYVRSALVRGLKIEERIGFNPYRFGLIGATDSHTGLATAEEPNFWGKFARDSIPENKQEVREGSRGRSGWSMSASGLAAVWASENSRDAILEAFRRKEVYATTGPRIGVRVFGGYGFDESDIGLLSEPDDVKRGVPMGGMLGNAADGQAPSFVVHASKDASGANLDRLQIIKGWVGADGKGHEHVYDVAWSNDRVAAATGAVPPVGNTVDPETGSYTNEIGSAALSAVWGDPDFDSSQRAFYYVRVLEIPTPRHSTFDALALGLDPREISKPLFIQERAYTSPIWYTP